MTVNKVNFNISRWIFAGFLHWAEADRHDPTGADVLQLGAAATAGRCRHSSGSSLRAAAACSRKLFSLMEQLFTSLLLGSLSGRLQRRL